MMGQIYNCNECEYAFNRLVAKCHKLERERDAAVADLKKISACNMCKFWHGLGCDDESCRWGAHWEWRGAQDDGKT